MHSREMFLLLHSMVVCPISHEIMLKPVRLNCLEEHTFDFESIQLWLNENDVCPLCKSKVTSFSINRDIEKLVQVYRELSTNNLAAFFSLAANARGDEQDILPSASSSRLRADKIKKIAFSIFSISLIQDQTLPKLFLSGVSLLPGNLLYEVVRIWLQDQKFQINQVMEKFDFLSLKFELYKLKPNAKNLSVSHESKTEIKKRLGRPILGFQKFENVIEEVANIEIEDKFGHTLLHAAAIKNDQVKVRLLLKAGAKLEAKDKSEFTPLHHAVNRNSFEVTQILVQAGANLEAQDQLGRTPLHHGAVINNVEVMQLLILSGANIEAKDAQGFTPLHHAANWNSPEVASLLIDAGADINAKDGQELTALDHSVKWNSPEVAQILLNAGAIPNFIDEFWANSFFSER